MNLLKPLLYLLLCLPVVALSASLPTGDNRGTVKAVQVMHLETPGAEGKNSFRIWFKSMSKERGGDDWNCHSGQGYVVVREANSKVSPTMYDQIFSLALTAQTTGKELAVDSGWPDPCNNVVNAWIVD